MPHLYIFDKYVPINLYKFRVQITGSQLRPPSYQTTFSQNEGFHCISLIVLFREVVDLLCLIFETLLVYLKKDYQAIMFAVVYPVVGISVIS